jgi:hypothetical protein
VSGNRLSYWDILLGDHLWAFRLSGTVAQAAAPTPPSQRNDIRTASTSVADAKNTVTLGRIWDVETRHPGAEENLVENARRHYLAR